jgi:hypothetical protein
MIITFSLERLARMPRPPEYLDELRACAISGTKEALTFDTESECYKALRSKYASHPSEWACAYRGPQIGTEQCTTCGGNVMAKVTACSIHGRATLFSKPIDGVVACMQCPDRKATAT